MHNQVLGLAITGLGHSCQLIPQLIECSELQLVMLHDPLPGLASRLSLQWNIPEFTTSFEDVLRSERVDLVFISSPNHIHSLQVIQALVAGKAVLCQKPLASWPAEGKKMLDASDATGRPLGVYLERLNSPLLWDIRSAILQGSIGKVVSVRSRNGSMTGLSNRFVGNWRSDEALVGGGSMMMVGIHAMSCARWLCGEHIISVAAYVDRLASTIGGEDVLAAAARLSNGALMVIESSYISCGWSIEIYGTNGYIIYDRQGINACFGKPYTGFILKIQENQVWQELALSDLYATEEQRFASEFHQIRQFACAVRDHRPLPYPAIEAQHDLEVIHAAYKAAKDGSQVLLFSRF